MDMMNSPLIEHRERDGWIQEKILGSGGFGAVFLWKHKETGELVAIKKCRVQNEMTPKHKHRWQLEVDIMKKLSHPNVIEAKEVPQPLDVSKDQLPLLAMEYCNLGDLRKVLNLPENCCGLTEFEIRALVKDAASAIEYLHSKRIIHRDLKPENVVLHQTEDGVVYKLIDLGYAKELEQGSVCTSFVGTLQYLAPELFTNQKYSCTVDYWSLGTVMFECICGYRPFLPHLPPVQWHKEVLRKSPDDIWAQQIDSTGVVKFSKKLPSSIHLNRVLENYFEQWLRLMLRWDSKARGGGITSSQRPKCFAVLDAMLDMKCVHVFVVETNDLRSYCVHEQHIVQHVQKIIEPETGIPIEEQDLLLASGVSPDANQLASTCCAESNDKEEFIVFLFRKNITNNTMPQERKFKVLPQLVQNIVKEPELLLPYSEQRKCWAESVYFCNSQVKIYKRLIQSQRAAMLSLLRANSHFLRLKTKMGNEVDQFLARADYFKASLQHDLQLYEQQVSSGISSSDLVEKWKSMNVDVDQYMELKNRVTGLDNQSVALQTRIVELQRSPFCRGTTSTEKLEELANRARGLYSDLRQSSKEKRGDLADQTKMVRVVVTCVVQRDKIFKDLYIHLDKIIQCKQELQKIIPLLEDCCTSISEANDKLLIYQQQRQTDVWNLISIALERSAGYSLHESKDLTSMMASISSHNSTESLVIINSSKETSKKLKDVMSDIYAQDEDMMSISQNWSDIN